MSPCLLRWPSILLHLLLLNRPRLPNIRSILELPLATFTILVLADPVLLGLGNPLLANMIVISELVGVLGRLVLLVLVPRTALRLKRPHELRLFCLANTGKLADAVGLAPPVVATALET